MKTARVCATVNKAPSTSGVKAPLHDRDQEEQAGNVAFEGWPPLPPPPLAGPQTEGQGLAHPRVAMHISTAYLHGMLPNMQLQEWHDSLQFAGHRVMQLLRQKLNDDKIAPHGVL